MEEYATLAYRDLLRGASMDIPSGEDIARALGEAPLDRAALCLPDGVCPTGTPLAYYVLREAELVNDGTYLGPVGGRLVAEVLVGLLRADATSLLHAPLGWRPEVSAADGGFTMAALLAATGSLGPTARTTARASRG